MSLTCDDGVCAWLRGFSTHCCNISTALMQDVVAQLLVAAVAVTCRPSAASELYKLVIGMV